MNRMVVRKIYTKNVVQIINIRNDGLDNEQALLWKMQPSILVMRE